MESLANLILEVKDELGADIAALFAEDGDYERYLNQGQRRLGFKDEKVSQLVWAASATSVALPADFFHLDRLIINPSFRLPQHKVWGSALRFLDPDGATTAGEATLYYYADFPVITGVAASELPPDGDTGIVAFACYRFFRRLASGRADYERYSTLLGANGVDLDELGSIADDYFAEFESARDSLPSEEPVSYYGD